MNEMMLKFSQFLAQNKDNLKEGASNVLGDLLSGGSQTKKQDVISGIGKIASGISGPIGFAAPLITGMITNEINQGEVLKSIADARNSLSVQTNPYQMKKGGYLKDENTYVTKDGMETRRGLWANVYLKKKAKKQDGGMIPNSMVDGGIMEMVSDDAQQVKASNPQEVDSVETPQAFLDHNEMVIDMPNGGKFVFSDFLKDPDTGESFATIAKGLVEKRDSMDISEEEYEMYISELANDNEKAKTMNKSKQTMKKGGKMRYQEGGDMAMDPAMQGGGMPMEQGMEQGMAPAQGQPDIMPEMGVEGDMGMGAMTEEGFPVTTPDGQTYVFSPDLKDPNTGQPFAVVAQEMKTMFDSGQMSKEDYDAGIQQLMQAQERIKAGMSDQEKAGMKCGGYMKKKMGGGGYMSKDMFDKMYKR